MKPFRSFQNVPILNQPEKPPTQEEMAADLALEMCERIKELRAEAKRREENAEPPLETSAEAKEAYETLDALMKGRHKWVVTPILIEQFPELVTAATAAPEPLSQVELKP